MYYRLGTVGCQRNAAGGKRSALRRTSLQRCLPSRYTPVIDAISLNAQFRLPGNEFIITVRGVVRINHEGQVATVRIAGAGTDFRAVRHPVVIAVGAT